MRAADYTPKKAFFFPGQGAQSVGMAKELCEECPAAKALFDKASEILGVALPKKPPSLRARVELRRSEANTSPFHPFPHHFPSRPNQDDQPSPSNRTGKNVKPCA